MKKKLFKSVGLTLMFSLGYQLIFPVCAYALTTGPSQPEVQSFEPVGTTEMVDMFSGDFNYNIPLLDVEGYPVNIFYHSGVGIEQEASWTGLGWNINPGEINRSVRGLPDDFNGDVIEKYTKIKAERDIRIGVGAALVPEVFGKDLNDFLASINVSLGLGGGLYVAQNSYKGIRAGVTVTVGIQTPVIDAGFSIGVGSQSGADIDAAFTLPTFGFQSFGIQPSGSTGFSSRSGLKDITLGLPMSYRNVPIPYSVTIPIGMQNYVPVVTNKTIESSFSLQLKAGIELFGALGAPSIDVTVSDINTAPNGSRRGFGYLHSENAKVSDITDFSRDKDGNYNSSVSNLPSSAQTYDIYSVTGQGTSGMFRPFRNDVGTIYDPYVSPDPGSESTDTKLEFGFGNAFEVGGNISTIRTYNQSGPWKKMPFSGPMSGTLFENVFFKQAGDKSYNQQQDIPQLFNTGLQYLVQDLNTLKTQGGKGAGSLPGFYSSNPARILWDNTNLDRSSRSVHIGYKTGYDAQKNPDMDQAKQIYSYEQGAGNKFYDPKVVKYYRYRNAAPGLFNHNLNSDAISEFIQTQADGRRYVYGIPAVNNVSREVTFAVDETKANLNNGYVGFTPGTDDGLSNSKGRDNFYSTINTPSYAHSYLLSSVLSNDYVDILGDGPSDDDPGTFVKFNYTLTDNDYRWRTPYKSDSAQFNIGSWSDKKDGKGNYMVGSRQQWYLRSIESKNYVAEFYTSKRKDALGVRDAILASGTAITNPAIDYTAVKTDSSFSYKLDSIKLYNKHDRYLNKDNAVPIKTIVMQYDYSLCPGIPNSIGGVGKLTLKKLFIKYGASQKNLLSPYVFSYNADNSAYNFAQKDRWGNHKVSTSGLYNFEFPYTEQPDLAGDITTQNSMLAAWNLTDVKLPSGGSLHVDYESDDYAFVQNKRSMQMLRIEGTGNSPAFAPQNVLYHSLKDINDYVYFKRRTTMERPGLSMRDNYLEAEDFLYYNFNLDVIANGSYDYVKGYARFDSVGICSDNSAYGFIKLRRDPAGSLSLHPATVYGINYSKLYLPHMFYDGYNESTDLEKIWRGLVGSTEELVNMIAGQNPFKRFINKQKAKYINPANSWIRVQTPNLAKKGGGLRVRQLVLSDNWTQLAGKATATYGKQYDYTRTDDRYGVISSGVASYEPMIGGDENPLRQPDPYMADGKRGLPSTIFFQEEPFGESFFPAASVGYSSVKVSSIHAAESRSAQSVDENLFYTAKDFPARVDYTTKEIPYKARKNKLFLYTDEVNVLQGYTLTFNDMHGKPKAVNNYVVHNDGSNKTLELITGIKYNYNVDANDRLDNNVNTLVRKRGTVNTYELRLAKLGMDMDFSVDSREKQSLTTVNDISLNLNTFLVFGFPVCPFTNFYPDKKREQIFRSMTSTKIVQQYGILKGTESFDHGAKTFTDNIVFDGETGNVLLSRTSNKFGDYTYDRKDPAYLAYQGMGAAYTNAGYEETADSLVVDIFRDGYLYTNNLDRFSPGDELEVNLSKRGRFPATLKVWVTGIGKGYAESGMNNVTFWKPTTMMCPYNGYFVPVTGAVTVNIYKTATPTVVFKTGSFSGSYDNADADDYPDCSAPGCLRFGLPDGSYNYTATGGAIYPSGSASGTFTIGGGNNWSFPLCNFVNTVGSAPYITTTCSRQGMGSCATRTPDPARRCGLFVSPRFKDRIAAGTVDSNISSWPVTRTSYKNVIVKVMRSGRRNNLDKMVQQTQYGIPATRLFPDLMSSISTYFGKTNNVLNVSVNTFTDTAQGYASMPNAARIPNGDSFGQFNPYVLGLNGNYRPLATYAPTIKRSYDKTHSRYDGLYTIPQSFWMFVNSYAGDPLTCNSPRNVLRGNTLAGTLFWKNAATTTRYDPYGNALEERDAIGNYTAAQYGYNKSLPVAVASNVRAQHFVFEGFEDYRMLLPQLSAQLYQKKDLYSPLAASLSKLISSVITDYPSEQPSGDNATFTRYNQRYNLRDYTATNGSFTVTNETSHTGFYSLKSNYGAPVYLTGRPTITDKLSSFSLLPGQKYIVNLWAKSTAGTPVTSTMFSTAISGVTGAVNMDVKTGSIDGWYLLEGTIDLSGWSSYATCILNVPSNVYVDDMRLLPVSANMKSFVYDPINFRLIAQLDENHMSTFYEYDQEGLLIRTKKETAKGIMTISESRRANSKQN